MKNTFILLMLLLASIVAPIYSQAQVGSYSIATYVNGVRITPDEAGNTKGMPAINYNEPMDIVFTTGTMAASKTYTSSWIDISRFRLWNGYDSLPSLVYISGFGTACTASVYIDKKESEYMKSTTGYSRPYSVYQTVVTNFTGVADTVQYSAYAGYTVSTVVVPTKGLSGFFTAPHPNLIRIRVVTTSGTQTAAKLTVGLKAYPYKLTN